ncbi:MAG: NAD-dependent epimerase/dehydratase family protein [Verrucomicrobiota bacterium]
MSESKSPSYFITGGAGFIGAFLACHLLDTTTAKVTVYDNFRTGRRWAFRNRLTDPRLTIIEGDVQNLDLLKASMAGHDVVYHLAANSDIASAATDPSIDFWQGTYLTHNVLEAMRMTGTKRILYTSGSGVYGDIGADPVDEDYAFRVPISTYGASKLGSEHLISAYAHMFNIRGSVFRFANVIGPHQTHGVAYDFLRRLAAKKDSLKIFGDGSQSKPYIFITDVLAAFRLVEREATEGFQVFNVAPTDFLTVKDIADIIVEQMGLHNVEYRFSGGSRGWKADVPVYRLDTNRIRKLGWANEKNSKEAMVASVQAMLADLAAGDILPAPLSDL